MSWLTDVLTEIRNTVKDNQRRLKALQSAEEARDKVIAQLADDVGDILELLTPPLAVKFLLVLSSEQLVDDGTVTVTLVPVDADGNATLLPDDTPAPTISSSNSAIVVVAASDGMQAVLTPAVPPVLATGVTISATAKPPSGKVIEGTSAPLDVVAGGPVGFSVVEKGS